MNTITKIYIITSLVLLFAFANPCPQTVIGQDSPEKTSGSIQYVLTRQGIIQEGIVQDRDQSVYIQFGKGKGGFTISKLDILFIGKTKEELLEYRRARIRPSDTAEILKLADWGIRNQLLLPALQMLKFSRESTEDLSSREILDKKIQQMEMIEKIRVDSLKKQKNPVRDPKIAEKEKERIDWEKWSKTIPLSVQEQFLRKVQPVLLRRCGSSGCHSEADEQNFIIRQTGNGSPARQNSLKNLAAVLEKTDLNQPSASSILSHSKIVNQKGIRVYPFGSDSNSLKDYEAFVKWISELEGKMKKASPSPFQIQKGSVPAGPAVNTQIDSSSNPLPVAPNSALKNATPKAGSKLNPVPDPKVPVKPGLLPKAGGEEKEPDDQKKGASKFQFQGPSVANEKASQKGDPNSTEEVYRRVGLLPTDIPKDIYDPILFNKKYH
ncbi:MAG: hypothetical protein Q4G69_02395 [Planctomycetia bacterium]|nr:hypothetical protein [Planctomycetia bacterium]